MRSMRRSAVVAAILLAPAVVVVVASALASAGWSGLADALGPLAHPNGLAERTVAQVLVFGCPAVAAVVALWPLARMRLVHGGDRGEASVSLRLAWSNLAIGVVAGGLAVLLLGHLVADAVACSAGLASAC